MQEGYFELRIHLLNDLLAKNYDLSKWSMILKKIVGVCNNDQNL